MFTENSEKSQQNYFCEKCNYITSRKNDFDKHKTTSKHINVYQCLPGKHQNSQKKVCVCGKEYSCKQSLYVHKKNCVFAEESAETNKMVNYEPTTPELISLIAQLVKGQSGLQDSILEICKNGTMNNSYNTTNSHNKTFNLNMFLNETCKDAMNITDFVDSIKFQLSDLENVGELGYVKGISNIIVKNLNALDITKRPVHCADKKREVLYVKDQDKWEKEDEDNKKLIKMIKRVAFKNYKQITQYKAKHPDCDKSESRYSDKYNKIIIESMGGAGDNEKENQDKIIRNISKEVVINKDAL